MSGSSPASQRHAVGTGLRRENQGVVAVRRPASGVGQVGQKAEFRQHRRRRRHHLGRLGTGERANAVDERAPGRTSEAEASRIRRCRPASSSTSVG